MANEATQDELLALTSIWGQEAINVKFSRADGTLVSVMLKFNGGEDAKSSDDKSDLVHQLSVHFRLTLDYPQTRPTCFIHCSWLNTEFVGELIEDVHKDVVANEVVMHQWLIHIQSAVYEHISNATETCEICFDDDICVWDQHQFLDCSHWYCKSCVQQHCFASLEQNILPINCPQPDCDKQLNPSDVLKAIGVDKFQHYDKKLLENCLARDRDITWCPNRDCQYAAQAFQSQQMGHCPSCDFIFCLNCKAKFHGPGEPCQAEYGEGEASGDKILSKDQLEAITLYRKFHDVKFSEYLDEICQNLFAFLSKQDKHVMVIQFSSQNVRQLSTKMNEAKERNIETFGSAICEYFALRQLDHFPAFCVLRYVESLTKEGHLKAPDKLDLLQLPQTKMCPHCQVILEKNRGCNHMHCQFCNGHFCWECLYTQCRCY